MPVVLEGPEYVYVNESDFMDDPYVIHLRKELGEHLKIFHQITAKSGSIR